MSKPAKAQSHHPSGSRIHGAGVLREHRHDAYRPLGKWAEGSTCPDCHAQVHQGAWRWVAAPERQKMTKPAGKLQRCPACERLRVDDPAGSLMLSGDFVNAHEAELQALLRHEAQRETAQHPQERLMAIERLVEGGLLVTTTGLHLARALGHALERAHRGHLRTRYAEGETRVRMVWHRDA